VDARVNSEVRLDRLVHADQKLVALVVHLRDGDVQAIRLHLPVADGRVALLGMVDCLDNDTQQLAVLMMARLPRIGECREHERA
jgi:hypothetical protein